METLEQLELCVDNLLERYGALKSEVARLQAELSGFAEEKKILVEENHKLKSVIAKQEAKRAEALRRVEGLLRKIQDHDSIE